MIKPPKHIKCEKCKSNLRVYQPSEEKETEWFMCDKYKSVPSVVLKGGQCEKFDASKEKAYC